jgi:RNA polymerase sigma-70 factor (ECF subfamily)
VRGRSLDFADVYDQHVFAVYGFFAYRVRGREEAEDLTQLTFERALRAWSRYDPDKASPVTWLLAIARNLLIDHYRADRRASHAPLEDAPEGALAVLGPEASPGLAPELAAALEDLGDREREILALRYGADLSGPEIARLCDLSLANVQQIISRSLRRLRERLASDAERRKAEQRQAGAAVGSDEQAQAARPGRRDAGA